MFLKVTLTVHIRQRGSAAIFSLFVLLAAVAAGATPSAWAAEGSQSLNAVVAVAPGELTVDPGETFTVEVMIQDVSNLDSFQFTLAYDPAVVRVSGIEGGSFLQRSGRMALGRSTTSWIQAYAAMA